MIIHWMEQIDLITVLASFFLNLFLLSISFSCRPSPFLFCECVWIGFTEFLPTSVCLAPKYPLLFEDCAAGPLCLVSWPHISNRAEMVLALFFAWMTWKPAWWSAFVARCVSYNHLRAWANGFLSEPAYFPPHWSVQSGAYIPQPLSLLES